MTEKIDLPDGGWAEIKTASEITRGEKREAENLRARALAEAVKNPGLTTGVTAENAHVVIGLSDEQLQPLEAFQNAMVKTCLMAWSRGQLPTDAADFLAMPDQVYEDLVLKSRTAIFYETDFGPDGAMDPKVPTSSSSDSEQPSTGPPDSSDQTTPTPG